MDRIATLWDWIKRNGLITVICLAALVYLEFSSDILQTMALIAIYFSMAVGLSGVALYAYTKIPFTRNILYGEDDRLDIVERGNMVKMQGYVFLGTCLLVGLTVMGLFYTQMTGG